MVALICIATAAALLLWPAKVDTPEAAEPKPPKKSRPRSRKEPKS